MQIDPRKIYGVITGDVVKSTTLTPAGRELLFKAMTKAGHEVRAHFGSVVPLDAEIFSGDGWQILVVDPAITLRIGLFYRAFLRAMMGKVGQKKLDTRLSIALGPVDFVPGRKVSQGEGEAFWASGRQLKEIEDERMRLSGIKTPAIQPWDATIGLLDAIVIENWIGPRALAITGALRGLKQAEIAKLWRPRISQSAVAQHLRAAQWPPVEKALRAFESVNFDGRKGTRSGITY